jgi:hypothetical protein
MKTRHLEADQWLNREEWCLGFRKTATAVKNTGHAGRRAFPNGPYGLYRASVPVQGCTLSFTF